MSTKVVKMQLQPCIGSPFVKALIASGVMPANCSRFIIDMPAHGVITAYAEVFIDDRMNDADVLASIRTLTVHLNITKRKTGRARQA